ncbi:MAG: alpha-hydroxy-acid oxidizing protein [Deltaproteobacteria bacterium]|nr:alpha-hydroxy-acid oxidizing protein [Deltaproteobacteria bacterium]
MHTKYHVNVQATPPRFPPVSKFSSLEIEGCLGCLECVKRSSCLYNVYTSKRFDPDQIIDTGDAVCINCLRCVQECKKNILSRAKNPRYEQLGDDYWKPDLIASLWRQSESGKIPVSGAGYRGPFAGPGFDQMWTDMSEIVRPTRDGIHGREYISSVIELGRRPARLLFDSAGKMLTEPPRFFEIPLPIVFDIPRRGLVGTSTREAMVKAAKDLDLLAVVSADEGATALKGYLGQAIVKVGDSRPSPEVLKQAAILEFAYADNVMDRIAELKRENSRLITSIRLLLDERAVQRAAKLACAGADIIHLWADDHGRGFGERKDDFLTRLVREVHLKLIEQAVREQVSVLVSGGLGMAEHVAKAIICGADGVGVDLALLVAMECRLCKTCEPGTVCPVQMDQTPVAWGAQRICNLIGSWHSQLIEVMGAMGIREVRRLRGELGRTMFLEDLEKENFSPLFGTRKPDADIGLTGIEYKNEVRADRLDSLDVSGQTFPDTLTAPCPSRYRNQLGRFRVVRSTACIACGKCAEVCLYGVHKKAGNRMLAPVSYLCNGPEGCREKDAYCADHCPVNALAVGPDPMWQTFGDPRWTAELLASTWIQAETGKPPKHRLEYRVGASGGGFDRIDLVFPNKPSKRFSAEEIDLKIPLNKRKDDNRPRVTIGFPVYGGGMSFGSISLPTMLARARAYKAMNSFTCTGEGGYPDELCEYDDHVITQVATGLFGVREETIQRVRIVEFKYAQGAKPGLGGHLLGDKVTPAVARMREAVEGNALFSPFPFHSVYSVEDHKKHVDWIKAVNPRALVSVKVSTPSDVDMVAVGSYYAGAHIIHLDGSYGGTGAAPDIAKKNIAMPIEYAIPKVHRFLQQEGIRDQMTLIASGGLRTAWDVAKAIALGADGVVVGTAEMVALECVRCGNCESGRGCPRGIATTDPELSLAYDAEWGAQRLINLFSSWSLQLREILWRFGMKSVRELVGRSDLLVHLDYEAPSAGERGRTINE